MTTADPTTSGLTTWRSPIRLFVASLVVFVVFVVVAGTVFPEPRTADLDAAQMEDLGLIWPLVNALWTIPIWLGTGAILLCCRTAAVGAAGPRTVIVRLFAVVSAIAITVYLVLTLTLTGSDADRLGDTWAHQAGTVASVAAWWPAIAATALLALVLRGAGVLGRSAIVLAFVSGLYLLVDVLSWLPVFTGSVDRADGGGLPPFLIAVIWCALGIVLRRRRGVSSAA